MNRTRQIFVAVLAVVLAMLACSNTTTRELNLYPPPTVEIPPTPMIVTVESSPAVVIVEVTVTSIPASSLCVNAALAVHLRPSPSDQNYPILVIPNGTKITDLGGRSEKWMFVQVGDAQGWVHGDYVRSCN